MSGEEEEEWRHNVCDADHHTQMVSFSASSCGCYGKYCCRVDKMEIGRGVETSFACHFEEGNKHSDATKKQ